MEEKLSGRSGAIKQVDPFVEITIGAFGIGIDQSLANFLSTVGIFSVSEIPNSHQMWGLYADSGRGFVVEFDATADFFNAANNRSLFRKVQYSDERLCDF